MEILGDTITSSVSVYWNGAKVSEGSVVGEFSTNFTAANGDTYIRGPVEDESTVYTAGGSYVPPTVTFNDKYKVARVAYGQEPTGDAGSGDDDDSDSNVPSDIPELYAGVQAYKAGTFSGASFWGVYTGSTNPAGSAFVIYNGQFTFLDFSNFSNSDTTSVTGSDGRTYYRGASHPEDGNPFLLNGFEYRYYGVGRE